MARSRARVAAAERLADESTWPTPQEEIWRYSRIDELDLDALPAGRRPKSWAHPATSARPAAARGPRKPALRAATIVVRDGRVVRHEIDPALEAKGVRVCDIATCDDELVQRIARVGGVGRPKTRSPCCTTRSSPAARSSTCPTASSWRTRSSCSTGREGDGEASFPHTLVVLGERAEATVLDRFGSPETEHFSNAVTELIVGDAAHLRYLSLQEHGPRTWHLGFQRAACRPRRDVAYLGGRARRRLRALAERGAARSGKAAESDQLAVYFGDNEQMLDFRTLQDHDAPWTRSNLLFKGAVEDEARSVYSGLVRLRKSAQKSDAHQTNRNLVLTEGAGAESIPNLEIEANDVRCSHASTVGPIDDDQLYYLESRGVPPAEAERLIVLGFFDDVFARLPVSALTQRLRGTVIDKLEHRRVRR